MGSPLEKLIRWVSNLYLDLRPLWLTLWETFSDTLKFPQNNSSNFSAQSKMIFQISCLKKVLYLSLSTGSQVPLTTGLRYSSENLRKLRYALLKMEYGCTSISLFQNKFIMAKIYLNSMMMISERKSVGSLLKDYSKLFNPWPLGLITKNISSKAAPNNAFMIYSFKLLMQLRCLEPNREKWI